MLAPGARQRAANAALSVGTPGDSPPAGDSPRDFLEACLAEIARLGARRSAPSSNWTSQARARRPTASSERWRAGKPLSPIDGMPVGIKDIIETADMPTEMGSPLFAGWRSQTDAACVAACARPARSSSARP